MTKAWLTENSSQQEDGLVDKCTSTDCILLKLQFSLKKKRRFRAVWKTSDIEILLKLKERSPLRLSIVRRQGYLSVTLAPQNTVKFDEALASASSLCCLVDKLFNQNRVDQNVADSTKIQCDELLKSVSNEPEYVFTISTQAWSPW